MNTEQIIIFFSNPAVEIEIITPNEEKSFVHRILLKLLRIEKLVVNLLYFVELLTK